METPVVEANENTSFMSSIKSWGSNNVSILFVVILLLVILVIYLYCKQTNLLDKIWFLKKSCPSKSNKNEDDKSDNENNDEELDDLVDKLNETLDK